VLLCCGHTSSSAGVLAPVSLCLNVYLFTWLLRVQHNHMYVGEYTRNCNCSADTVSSHTHCVAIRSPPWVVFTACHGRVVMSVGASIVTTWNSLTCNCPHQISCKYSSISATNPFGVCSGSHVFCPLFLTISK
jgi:hypothetical protein